MNSPKSYSDEWSPKSKFAIFFPAKPEKSKICENKLPWKHSRHTVNCERVCFSCNLSAFVPRFQQSRIRELRKFFGQESHRPPKSEGARTPMLAPDLSFEYWRWPTFMKNTSVLQFVNFYNLRPASKQRGQPVNLTWTRDPVENQYLVIING